jgi:N-formylglutamate deformylase
MAEKLPFLLIIPHSGLDIPEELYGYENVSPLNIFFESDAGAGLIFSDDKHVLKTVTTDISKLFVDVDRDYRMLSPLTDDGVIKTKTSMNREVFKKNCHPDEIAISNILTRYYSPFHEKIRTAMKEIKFKAIIECHTHMPVGPANSPDRGMPRSLVITGYTASTDSGMKQTASADMAIDLAAAISKNLSGEGETVSDIFRISDTNSKGFIMKHYSISGIPVLNLSLSRSLFLNEKFFDLEKMIIDVKRIHHLKTLVFNGLLKFYKKCF